MLYIFGRPFTIPFFWRYDAAFQQGRDETWRQMYAEYEPQVTALRKRVSHMEGGIFELYDGEVITMSRACELLGEKHVDPVRERYRKWKSKR